MVYLSQPTENGTLYSLAELTDLWETCQDCGLFLFVDGARLGYGLMSEACDMTLPDLARRCDGFSIGGTKQGLLFGEALVLSHPALRRDFRYHIKQHGGLLAKGRLLGVQFCAILEDGLYFELARHADRLAMELRRAFETRGYEMLFDSYTNQQYHFARWAFGPTGGGICPYGLEQGGRWPHGGAGLHQLGHGTPGRSRR